MLDQATKLQFYVEIEKMCYKAAQAEDDLIWDLSTLASLIWSELTQDQRQQLLARPGQTPEERLNI
jgi:hypothetical protein